MAQPLSEGLPQQTVQVLVLDPSIIPQSVGEFIYELHFRAEPEELQNSPEPMDMDDDGKDDRGEEGANGAKEPYQMQHDMPPQKNSGGAAKVVAPSSTIKPSVNNSQHGRKLIHHIQAIEMMRESSLLDWPTIEDAESDSDEDELQDMHNSYNISEEAALISELGTQVIPAAEMAAILETATPGRRSKRRAEIVDESSLEHTKKIKSARNLDFNPAKGNIKNRRTLLYKYNFSMSKLLVISMQ
jgi:hypothetical protein